MDRYEEEYEKGLEKDLEQETNSVINMENIATIVAGIIIISGCITIFFGMVTTIYGFYINEIVRIYFIISGFLSILGGVFIYCFIKVYCVMAYNLIRITDILDRIEHKK